MPDDIEEAAAEEAELPTIPDKSRQTSTNPDKETVRDEELSGREEIRKELEKLISTVDKGFDDQNDRADLILDYWDAYNCQLGRWQNYTSGFSQIYIPIIRNGVDALVTRYVNQSFPQSGRHIEAVTPEEEEPYALLSLMEHYVERARLRTQAARSILLNGQIEGQYNAEVKWVKVSRYVVSRETEPMTDEMGMQHPALGEVETVAQDRVDDAYPMLEALHDNDVLVLPATASSIPEALAAGGSVTVIQRWTKSAIEQLIDDGDFVEEEGEALLEAMGGEAKPRDTEKRLAGTLGIHVARGSSFAIGYKVWKNLRVDGKDRLCRIYFGATDRTKVLGCKLNPYWNDKCPVFSVPVDKRPGVFKGEAPVAACCDQQYQANDAANEAGHMLYFSLSPMVIADPQGVPKWRELISAPAAVWPGDPNSFKTMEWPNKVREALEIIAFNKSQIFETLGISPALMPQQTGRPGAKRNQAEIAMEQQVELLQTADAVTVFEQEILTPAVQWFADLDHQFREDEITVRQYGELGLMADMEAIEPTTNLGKVMLRWAGVEAARNAAMIQQQISMIGTLSKIPPQQLLPYRLSMAAFAEHAIGQVMPPRLARLTLKPLKDELGFDAETENELLQAGHEVLVHVTDDDNEHLQIHMQIPQSYQRDAHIHRHKQQAMMKQQAAMAAMSQESGVRSQGPGPRAGAQRGGQRSPQQPAGAIRPDRMAAAGAPGMPRKT